VQGVLTLWWLAGALLIGLALPLAAIMLVLDHRRHRHWPSTGLAIVWCLLAVSVVGVSGGNLSPPLFGVPLVLLYAVAWAKKPTLAAIGVTMSYVLALLVLLAVFRGSSEVRWAFVLAWAASAVALAIWRTRRPAHTVS
jgi:hypothetical protein